jgi:hypothetical protein
MRSGLQMSESKQEFTTWPHTRLYQKAVEELHRGYGRDDLLSKCSVWQTSPGFGPSIRCCALHRQCAKFEP